MYEGDSGAEGLRIARENAPDLMFDSGSIFSSTIFTAYG